MSKAFMPIMANPVKTGGAKLRGLNPAHKYYAPSMAARPPKVKVFICA